MTARNSGVDLFRFHCRINHDIALLIYAGQATSSIRLQMPWRHGCLAISRQATSSLWLQMPWRHGCHAISRHDDSTNVMTILHYNAVIMGAMSSQITSLVIVYSTVYSDADQRKQQSSASLAFVRGIRRWPANSSHKWPVTRKMFPFDDVIMLTWVLFS